MEHCPSEQELADLLSDRLSPERGEALESHIEDCPKCQRTLENLVAVPLSISRASQSSMSLPGDRTFLKELEKKQAETTPPQDFKTIGTGEKKIVDYPFFLGYEVVGILGQGGMGVVYKAWQTSLKRWVALKMVLAGDHAGSEERTRFRIEAEASARLQHPHIVQIHEVAEESGRPFFALEYVEGGSLAQKLKSGPLPISTAAELVETLARAMHYAHQRGIIHRDLKPSNVLLQQTNKSPAKEEPLDPKITDFGLAKLDNADHTRTGSILGTPMYMAPEQADGRTKDISTAVDIYALGVILYEALTGRPPFRGATVAQTLQMVVEQEPAPPRSLRPSVSKDLETICLKCLQKLPRQRYASAFDLAEDLRRYRMDEPIQARPIPGWQQVIKWARRRPAFASLLAVIFVSAAVLLGGGWWYQKELEKSLDNLTVERDNAKKAEDIAEQRRMDAERLRDKYQQTLYLANIPSAYAAWESAHVGKMSQLLDDAASRISDQKDLRHFEWNYLKRLPSNNSLHLLTHPAAVTSVVYAPGGAQLATACADGGLRIWDSEKGSLIKTIDNAHTGKATSVAYHPDGTMIASSGADKRICLWNAVTGELIRQVGTHAGYAYQVAFNASGQFLASAGADKTILLWDLKKEGPPKKLIGHNKQVTAVAFSADGKWLASAGADRTVRVWDLQEKEKPRQLDKHTGWVYAVAFSPDSKTLFSCSFDHTIRIWNITADKSEPVTLNQHSGQVRGLALSSDGSRVASASFDQTVRIWDVHKGEQILRLRGHLGKVNAVAFNPNGQSVASAGDDQTVRIWDITDQQDYSSGSTYLNGPVHAVAFTPDNGRLVSAGAEGRIEVWNLQKRKPELMLAGHTDTVNALAVSVDGRQLASGGSDRTVQLWNLDKPEIPKTLKGQKGTVTSLAFAGDGRLASGSFDGNVRIWSPGLDARPLILSAHTGNVLDVAFHPKKNLLASCGQDKLIQFWDAESGTRRQTLKLHDGWVHRVAFSPDGNWLISGGADGEIVVWDLATEKEYLRFSAHEGKISSLAMTPDSKRLASAGFFDKTVKIWDLNRGQELLSLNHYQNLFGVAFSPDGSYLATASADRTLHIFDGRPIP